MKSASFHLRVVAIALLLIVSLLCLIAAQAKGAPPTAEVQADYAAAVSWWGGASDQCGVVILEMAPTDPKGEGKTARATQPKAGEFLAACWVEVYEDKWASESTCMHEMVLRHEVGHTRGLGHDTDSPSIMAEAISPEVWCGEGSGVATTPPPPPTRSELAAMQARMVRTEWLAQTQRCLRIAGKVSARRLAGCWSWARFLRAEYRTEAARV